MEYISQNFSHLKGMPGFSDKALETHFALYDGYVKNTNKLLAALDNFRREAKTDTPEYAELKRRLGWEFDGMRLHEFYFSSLGGDGELDKKGKIAEAFKSNFGGYEAWKNDFLSTAKMRGIGWAVLYQDPTNGKLMNFWINEHNGGHPAGLNLILNVDVFEHAFMLDYGTDRGGYLEAFMKNLNWGVIEKRLM